MAEGGGMAGTGRRTATRALAAVGAGAGTVLLLRPERAVDRFCPEFPRSRFWLVRLLGGRLLLQHGAVLVAARPEAIRLGSGIDLLHAASMMPFVGSPRYSRAARISGGLSAVYAAVALAVAPRSERG
jgi:hypothetical protein